jgi:hypothetical protein
VAIRYDFDGYGWKYIDNFHGSNWRERVKHLDAENLYTTPLQRKPLTITEESAWDLARYVYARSNPHEIPHILLSPMEIKQIIEAAHNIKE